MKLFEVHAFITVGDNLNHLQYSVVAKSNYKAVKVLTDNVEYFSGKDIQFFVRYVENGFMGVSSSLAVMNTRLVRNLIFDSIDYVEIIP